jgi:hypothetical protein
VGLFFKIEPDEWFIDGLYEQANLYAWLWVEAE